MVTLFVQYFATYNIENLPNSKNAKVGTVFVQYFATYKVEKLPNSKNVKVGSKCCTILTKPSL